MKYVKQFGIIAAISFVSEILHALLPLPVPASIYGLLLLFALLALRVISVSAIRETGYFLIEIMPLMFIPAAVGLIEAWGILRPSWIAYLTITVVSTVAVMGLSGLVTQGIIRCRKKEGASNG